MKKSKFLPVLSLVIVLSMVMAACQAPATPTMAAEATATEAMAAEATATEAMAAEPTATEAMAAEATAAPSAELDSMSADSCDYGGEFKSIEAVDEKTVKFSLCYPDPAFPSKVAFNVFAIAKKADLEAAKGDSIMLSDKANGTGPFKLDTWARGDSVTYTANPDYWGTLPAYQSLVIKWSEQSAQRLLELQSGNADGIDNPAPEDFATIEGDSNLQLIPREALNVFYIGFNNTIPPFDNVKVRQAIAVALDRQRIVDEYYPEGSLVANSFVPPSMTPGYSESVQWYEHSVEEAKKILADSGWDSSQEITLSYRNVVRGYLPTPDKVGQEIQAQLAEVGITVKLDQQESTTFLDNTQAGNVGFYMLGWGADYPDATNFYDYHFANDSSLSMGTLWPDIVEPIRKAAQVADPAKRQEYYDIVNEKIKEHLPVIPMAHGGSAVAFTAVTENAMTGPLSNEPFYLMNPGKDTLVWVQNGEPAALWCSDETDGESLRACQQIYEPLLNFKPGSVEVVPSLAESWVANDDATEYTFTLRDGVKFHDGSLLSVNDVVASFVSMWDASSPMHTGRTGTFEYFGAFFGTMLNAPATE